MIELWKLTVDLDARLAMQTLALQDVDGIAVWCGVKHGAALAFRNLDVWPPMARRNAANEARPRSMPLDIFLQTAKSSVRRSDLCHAGILKA